MTPREREIMERLKAGSERFASDMTYLLSQLTTARALIEEQKKKVIDLQRKLAAANYRPQRRAQFKQRLLNPEGRIKNYCRLKTRRAIKLGYLIPQPCEKCGDPNSQAHHEDYSKPQVVSWMCAKCHAAEHVRDKCRNGHAYTPDNVYLRTNGTRYCKQCQIARSRATDAKRKAARALAKITEMEREK